MKFTIAAALIAAYLSGSADAIRLTQDSTDVSADAQKMMCPPPIDAALCQQDESTDVDADAKKSGKKCGKNGGKKGDKPEESDDDVVAALAQQDDSADAEKSGKKGGKKGPKPADSDSEGESDSEERPAKGDKPEGADVAAAIAQQDDSADAESADAKKCGKKGGKKGPKPEASDVEETA